MFNRLDLNLVTADVERTPERHELLTLTFPAPGLGTGVREKFRRGKLKDRDSGAFTVVTETDSNTNQPPVNETNAPPALPNEIPAALNGLTHVFQDGAHPN